MSRTAPSAPGSIPRIPVVAVPHESREGLAGNPRGGRAADPGDLPERIAEAAGRVLSVPRLADAIAFEVALVVYAIAGGRMRPRAGTGVFGTHREAAWASVALGLALATLVEAFPVHVLVHRAHPSLAWILTAMSASALLWLLGDYQALRLRPIVLEPEALLVRIGLRRCVRVPLAAISSFLEVRGDPPSRRDRGYVRATTFGDPTVVLELVEPLRVSGPYGTSTSAKRIGLAPDERARFLVELRAALVRSGGAGRATPAP